MNKPYHEMSPAERLADRIAKNRGIERKLMSGSHGLSLQGIVGQLHSRKQRASYGAVAELVGVIAVSLMSGRPPRSFEYSWIVASTTHGKSRRGWPSGYSRNQIHPDCYRQICGGIDNIIDDAEVLRGWLANAD